MQPRGDRLNPWSTHPTNSNWSTSSRSCATANRRHVYDALASAMLDVRNPTRNAVELLVEAVAGNIIADEHKACVLTSVAARLGATMLQSPLIAR
jgi:hypothetical protein